MPKQLVRAFLAVPILAFAVLAADPLVGTWKLNTSKSKVSPVPVPKSLTFKYETDGNAVKATMNGRDPEGKPISQGYSVTSFDKDGPATGSETWDTVALNRIDPNTVDALLQKNGKVVQSSSLMVSNDVKTLTINAPGTNEQGQNTGA